jgi:4-hydroxy-tetrahydrodipicolinate reductase
VQSVCVCGAAGRMGRSVVAAVEAEGDMRVAASVDPALTPGEGRYPSLAPALEGGGIDVVVDFTRPEAVFGNARAALQAGVHAVVGTTGLTEEQVVELRGLAESGPANLVIAPNFAVGAVLMMRFAAEASRHMARAEIVELHHDGKLDAPSGTALRTAGMMEGEVPIHSVRLPGLVAHQEVLLGGLGETLTIRHDSLSRESFMPGVVMAVRAVPDRRGLTLGLEPILFDDERRPA